MALLNLKIVYTVEHETQSLADRRHGGADPPVVSDTLTKLLSFGSACRAQGRWGEGLAGGVERNNVTMNSIRKPCSSLPVPPLSRYSSSISLADQLQLSLSLSLFVTLYRLLCLNTSGSIDHPIVMVASTASRDL
jgi:hypothetical protein